MRWVVSLLLIAAALLKGVEIFVSPTSAFATSMFSLNWSPYLLPVQIGGEFGIGLAVLLFGAYWQQLRWFVVAVFTCFACYSLYLIAQGAASCGCFGPVLISPWWTLAIDAVVLVGLLFERLVIEQRVSSEISSSNTFARKILPWRFAGIAVASISLSLTLLLACRIAPEQADTNQLLQAVGDLTILEPETWVGQEFPLAKLIDIDVSSGLWIVLLHRHDCPKCQEALPKYERLASSEPSKSVAVVEVPPHAEVHGQVKYCRCGRLTNEREWFVQTPVEIQLLDGQVIKASHDLPALNALSEDLIQPTTLKQHKTIVQQSKQFSINL